MAWFAFSDHKSEWRGFAASAKNDLLPCGTLMVQVRINDCPNGSDILRFEGRTPWQRSISLAVTDTGHIALHLTAQGQREIYAENGFANPSGAKDLLVTYAWDAPKRAALLTVSDAITFQGHTTTIDVPAPLFRADLIRLAAQVPAAPVEFVALSGHQEPIGPMPGISPLSLIDTPNGPRRAGELTTGDMVCTDAGEQPVLARSNLTLPSAGVFAPTQLHAPFHGLKQSLALARHQQLVFDGTDVEYDLGQRNVLISSGHLTTEVMEPKPDLITYCQFLLPVPAGISAQGAALASVNLGRLRRNRTDLARTLFCNLPEELLPDHGEFAGQPMPEHTFRMLADGHHF